ncbi:MAG: hypothetical protein E6I91_01105 [Chloroflexi bacterium]|nr:MAG: hypothetical protein E6I91_01105 [Chloroflexota bacterium]
MDSQGVALPAFMAWLLCGDHLCKDKTEGIRQELQVLSAHNERSRRGGKRRRQAPEQERRTGQEENGNKPAGMADRGVAKRMQLPSRENRGRFHVHRAPRDARVPKERSILVVTRQRNQVYVAQTWPSWMQLGSVETKRERPEK